jgi:hypothetical protein
MAPAPPEKCQVPVLLQAEVFPHYNLPGNSAKIRILQNRLGDERRIPGGVNEKNTG